MYKNLTKDILIIFNLNMNSINYTLIYRKIQSLFDIHFDMYNCMLILNFTILKQLMLPKTFA